MPKTRKIKRSGGPAKTMTGKLAGFHDGGVVKNPTGRYIGRSAEVQSLSPPSLLGKVARVSPLVGADYSKIEKRVMAATVSDVTFNMENIAKIFGIPGFGKSIEDMLRDEFFRLGHRAVWKVVWPFMQDQCDEEGCGAVMSAARFLYR